MHLSLHVPLEMVSSVRDGVLSLHLPVYSEVLEMVSSVYTYLCVVKY